jgi:hypothetical protein
MTLRGAIYAEDRYVLAKMLDHSCWQQGEQSCWEKDAPRLPRVITPSDLDTVFCRLLNDPMAVPLIFDNDGCMIFAELSSNQDDWRLISTGQYKLYAGLLGGGSHCAMLCRHNIKPNDGKKICTRHNIISFQPMVWDYGPVISATVVSNSLWQKFVFNWFTDPIQQRRRLIGLNAGLKPLSPVT